MPKASILPKIVRIVLILLAVLLPAVVALLIGLSILEYNPPATEAAAIEHHASSTLHLNEPLSVMT